MSYSLLLQLTIAIDTLALADTLRAVPREL